jgi:TRAP-type C4-dicarboxylate transport system substrate-binding protein
MIRKALAILVISLLASAPALAADVVKMDCNAIYGSSSIHTQGAMYFAEKVKEYSDGTVQITVHPGGALGFKGPELLKSVKDGTLPMSDILMGVVSGSEDVFGLSTYPRLVDSFKEANRFYQTARPYYEKACEKWNQKFLYAAPWPPSGLVANRAIQAPSDFSGLKTRTYDKNGAFFLEELGANPMSLPWGEVPSALSTGLIDSVLTSSESTNNGALYETLSDFTSIKFAFPLNMLVINMDYWNALSGSQKAAMMKAAAETELHQWDLSQKKTESALQAIKDKGMNTHEPTPEVVEAMDEVAKQMIEDFKQGAGSDAKAALEAFGK